LPWKTEDHHQYEKHSARLQNEAADDAQVGSLRVLWMHIRGDPNEQRKSQIGTCNDHNHPKDRPKNTHEGNTLPDYCRGRDDHCWSSPAQIRTCAFTHTALIKDGWRQSACRDKDAEHEGAESTGSAVG